MPALSGSYPRMEWLNYHHLLYFHVAAREGSIARASEQLRLAQPTISGQIKLLEDRLGERLFERAGRGIRLTEMGRVVFRYSEEIFGLGRELLDTVKGRPSGRPVRLLVGVSDVVPKLIVKKLLEPVLRGPDPVQLFCREATPKDLMASLAMHELDVVIADAAIGANSGVRVFHHLLGESTVDIFGTKKLASLYKKGFPKSLDGAPLLFPSESTHLRRALEQWFEQIDSSPKMIAEFEDSALLKTFGQDGLGLFAAPTAIAAEIERQYDVVSLGTAKGVVERYYAISAERKIKHPAVVAISENARQDLFA